MVFIDVLDQLKRIAERGVQGIRRVTNYRESAAFAPLEGVGFKMVLP